MSLYEGIVLSGLVLVNVWVLTHRWRTALKHNHQWGPWRLDSNSSEYQMRICEDKTCNQHQVMDTWK